MIDLYYIDVRVDSSFQREAYSIPLCPPLEREYKVGTILSTVAFDTRGLKMRRTWGSTASDECYRWPMA